MNHLENKLLAKDMNQRKSVKMKAGDYISGGFEAIPNEFPFMVALRDCLFDNHPLEGKVVYYTEMQKKLRGQF